MKTRRIILSILSAILLLSVVGCTAGENPPAPPESGADTPADSESKSAGDEGEPSPLNSVLESKIPLRFDENGQFRILVLADLHLNTEGLPKVMADSIRTLVDRERPDLIILTGDNTASSAIVNDGVLTKVLKEGLAYIESCGIPWMHVYGNHDAEHGYPREKQQAVYESFPHCISKAGEDLTGVGNYVIPIYGSDDEVKFAVWGLDSGDYLSKEDKEKLFPSVSAYGGYDGTEYGYIHADQVHWYTETSRLLEEELGRKIPGLMAFHIPLQEYHTAWLNRAKLTWTGDRQEPICASPHNSGLFNAIYARGDIKAIVCGHDHLNDFMVEYGGVKLSYSPSLSTNTYNREELHGGRVFILHENDPENVETYMSYVKERKDYSSAEPISAAGAYGFEGTEPKFSLTSWPNATGDGTFVSEIRAEICEGAGVDGSKALGITREKYNSTNPGNNIEVRWDAETFGKLENSKYLLVWMDLQTNDMDFRKACFGVTVDGKSGNPYATDDYDKPTPFYYKADGSDTWVEMKTGKDGCVGIGDGCSLRGYKGMFAFPVEYMLTRINKDSLSPSSVITGYYFYLSLAESGMAGKYVYIDNISFAESYE